jgi:hypothetical protein
MSKKPTRGGYDAGHAVKKPSPATWEIVKENLLNYPEDLPLFDYDGSFLSLAWNHARMLRLERDPKEEEAILSDLTQLARIPSHLEDRFKSEVSDALRTARLQWVRHGGFLKEKGKKLALRKAEQKVREALIAVRALHPVEQEALFHAALPRLFLDDDGPEGDDPDDSMRRKDGRERDWRRVGDMLSAILVALAEVSGRSPLRQPRGKRGRPKGDAGNWPFQDLVRALWIAADRCHGSLAANSKNGAMMRALARLQPLLPPDLQHGHAPPYTTVSRTTKAAKSEATRYERFTGDDDADWEIKQNDEKDARWLARMQEERARAKGLCSGLEKHRTKYSK